MAIVICVTTCLAASVFVSLKSARLVTTKNIIVMVKKMTKKAFVGKNQAFVSEVV